MAQEITKERVAELTNTPRCNWMDLFKANDAPSADLTKAIDEYLAPFVKHEPKTPCVNCGTKQADGIMSAMMGGFTWGLAHGEGHCEICKWPARAYHVINDSEGKQIAKFTLILQYHPNEIKFRENERAA